jgi:hypothetical protein
MSYLLLKDIHSVLRWIVILTLLWTLLRYWSGLLSRSEFTQKDRTSGLIFTTFLNLQLLLGIIVYATSPFIKGLMANFGGSMKDSVSRFYLVEHPVLMLLAVIIAQVGFSLSKRAPTDRSRFLKGTVAYTIAGILILIAIPWPFMKYGRPLFPAIGG